MDIISSLEQAGLSERESRIYLALLDIGHSTTSRLIRKTGIASSKIYDVLEKLEHKGLVTHIIEKGKKHFQAVNPDKLIDLLKEKENSIIDILPRLKEMHLQKNEEINAEIYKGKEGIKAIFEDILKTGKNWYALGASGKAEMTLPYFMPHFYKRMKEDKIKLMALFVDNETTRKQAKELIKYKNIRKKFLPKQIKNLMVIFIYGEKIVIIPITKTIEVEPIAILINSKETAESYKSYFEWLWGVNKKSKEKLKYAPNTK